MDLTRYIRGVIENILLAFSRRVFTKNILGAVTNCNALSESTVIAPLFGCFLRSFCFNWQHQLFSESLRLSNSQVGCRIEHVIDCWRPFVWKVACKAVIC